MSNVPLPEPAAWQVRRNDYGLWESTYFEECSEWEAKNCVAAADLRQLYTAYQMQAYAAAVSAAKNARIKVLEDALRKAVVQNEHDMLMTGEELRAARAALGDSTSTTPPPSPSPRS